MNKITKTFTYDIADDYLLQTDDLKKTGTYTYTGPDKIYIFFDKETNKWGNHSFKYLTDRDNGADYPTPIDAYKITIDCNINPELCHLFGADENIFNYASLPMKSEELPDGLVYTRNDPPAPDHTYEVRDMVYDPVAEEFVKPYPWKQPHITWANTRNWRNNLLNSTDHVAEADDVPESLSVAWQEYRQKLRDLPQVHGATNIFKTIDLTATAPINQENQLVLQLTDVADIDIGMDVGMTVHGSTDIFSTKTTVVVYVDLVKKQITLSDQLISTPTEDNSAITFSPAPETPAWKIGAYNDPAGFYGTLDEIIPEPTKP